MVCFPSARQGVPRSRIDSGNQELPRTSMLQVRGFSFPGEEMQSTQRISLWVLLYVWGMGRQDTYCDEPRKTSVTCNPIYALHCSRRSTPSSSTDTPTRQVRCEPICGVERLLWITAPSRDSRLSVRISGGENQVFERHRRKAQLDEIQDVAWTGKTIGGIAVLNHKTCTKSPKENAYEDIGIQNRKDHPIHYLVLVTVWQ